MKRYIYLFGLLLLFSACERTIAYKGEKSAPKLVLQAEMGEGDRTIACYVCRSYFFLDNQKSVYPYREIDTLKNVTLAVEADNEPVAITSETVEGNIHYLSLPFALQAGQTVHIRASHPDFGTVEAEDIIMPAPSAEVLTMKADSVNRVYKLRLRLHEYPLKDAVMGLRALLHASYKDDSDTSEYNYTAIRSSDDLFAFLKNSYSTEHGFNSNGDLFFPSDYAAEREVEITMPGYELFNTGNRTGRHITFDSLEVTVSALTEDALLYYRSMATYLGWANEDDTDLGAMIYGMIGLEEPMPVYSNVTGGYGIVAGKSKQTTVVK